MKIIIWGYPLHTDTLSYVWNGFYRAFKHLGYEVYWFNDNDYPKDFDWTNCVFLCEEYKSKNIPINSQSDYLVHTCINPERFNGVRRLVDLRYSCDYQDHDVNYKYVLDRYKNTNIGPSAWYEKNNGDKIYLAWATNLLPHEINFEDRFAERTNDFYFIGTKYSGKYENESVLNQFTDICKRNNIACHHINPWVSPVSDEENQKLISKSFLAPDLRGPQNVSCGYIPCRIFKHISYDQLGLTNSRAVYSALNEQVIYHPNIEALFDLGVQFRKDYPRILRQMAEVKEYHTYINRIQSLRNIGLV